MDDSNIVEKEWESQLLAPPIAIPDLGTPTPILPATPLVPDELPSPPPAPSLDDTPAPNSLSPLPSPPPGHHEAPYEDDSDSPKDISTSGDSDIDATDVQGQDGEAQPSSDGSNDETLPALPIDTSTITDSELRMPEVQNADTDVNKYSSTRQANESQLAAYENAAANDNGAVDNHGRAGSPEQIVDVQEPQKQISPSNVVVRESMIMEAAVERHDSVDNFTARQSSVKGKKVEQVSDPGVEPDGDGKFLSSSPVRVEETILHETSFGTDVNAVERIVGVADDDYETPVSATGLDEHYEEPVPILFVASPAVAPASSNESFSNYATARPAQTSATKSVGAGAGSTHLVSPAPASYFDNVYPNETEPTPTPSAPSLADAMGLGAAAAVHGRGSDYRDIQGLDLSYDSGNQSRSGSGAPTNGDGYNEPGSGNTVGMPPPYTEFATSSSSRPVDPLAQRPLPSLPENNARPASPERVVVAAGSPQLPSSRLPPPELDSEDSDIEIEPLTRNRPRRQKKKTSTREKLTFCSIVCNVIYNVLLLTCMVAIFAAYMMYEWIETDLDAMNSANIQVSSQVPGFRSVSCGLSTYCIDAAGTVSECTLPWPRYGDKIYETPIESPYLMWKISSGLLIGSLFLIFFAWVYTFFACFGCFNNRVQRRCNNLVVLAGLCMVGALVCFAYSFGDLAVDECISPNENATVDSNPPCTLWRAQLPSETIEGPGNARCRICPPEVSAFTISTSCTFGWGAIGAAGATVLVFISSVFGSKVTPRHKKQKRKKTRKQKLRSSNLGSRQESTV